MARLFNQRGVWYLDVQVNGRRIRKSLNTQDKSTAKKLSKKLEPQIISNILVGNKPFLEKNTSMKDLINQFLAFSHEWKDSTKAIYQERLKRYIDNGYPDNPSSKAMTIRCLNKMYKWGYENNLINKSVKIEGGSRWESRMRTFNCEELNFILNNIKPDKFQRFVRFAYYTGARRGEIASLSDDNIKYQYVVGKSGKRPLKLNLQAQEVLLGIDSLWNYNPGYITQTFKKNLRRLGIQNGRFHDLRRTFGLNLIKQGMPIYEVSKLLGHASVKTTEKHYAPLLVTEIKDFVL